MKRNKLELIHDILKVIRDREGKIKPTHIMYKANLSHKMLDEYISMLIEKELIVEKKTKRGKTYFLTDNGYDYLNKFKLISEFVSSFGLD